jgi:beta-lactamase class A
MTSYWSRFGLALVALGMTQVGASATSQYVPPATTATIPAQPLPRAQPPRVPIYLQNRITALGSQFNGRVGISVKSVSDGWSAGWKADELYPQQSVSKLWVAITTLDAVDKGRISLGQRVNLTRSDLTLFHQPIAAKILGGGANMSLSELMFQALTRSDNTANDKLMRTVGGPSAVRAMIAEKRLGAIRFYDGERALQSKIAGLIWSQSYSVGGAFYRARDALPYSMRKSAFDRYVADPYDGASASAIANALARLKRGELLSPASTARLLSVMGKTTTGANRLKGGLKAGWSLSHKTGTGQELGAVQAGYNDIGVLTAPDGRSYAVAVMIKRTSTPLPTRMTLMNNVVRAVINQHEMSRAPAYTL